MPAKRKVAIYGIDARGHTRPLLRLAEALILADFEVDYLTPSRSADDFSGIGANVIRIESDMIDPGRPMAVPKDYDEDGNVASVKVRAVADAADNLPKIISYIEKSKPDILLFDKMCMAGRFAARHCGIASATLHPTYCGSHIMRGAHPVFDIPRNPETIAMIEAIIARMADSSRHGPSGIAELFADHDACNIVFLSKEFHPAGQDLNDGYHFVGPLLRPGDGAETATRNLAYVSLGSLVGVGQDEFFRSCMAAFRDLDEIVVSIANSLEFVTHDLGDLPDNVRTVTDFDQARQLRYLSQAKVFVTHGGMNSVQEAIWCGTPMVAVPFGFDSQLTSARVEELGCGARLSRAESTVETLRAAAARVIDRDEVRDGLRRQREFAIAGGGLDAAVTAVARL